MSLTHEQMQQIAAAHLNQDGSLNMLDPETKRLLSKFIYMMDKHSIRLDRICKTPLHILAHGKLDEAFQVDGAGAGGLDPVPAPSQQPPQFEPPEYKAWGAPVPASPALWTPPAQPAATPVVSGWDFRPQPPVQQFAPQPAHQPAPTGNPETEWNAYVAKCQERNRAIEEAKSAWRMARAELLKLEAKCLELRAAYNAAQAVPVPKAPRKAEY